MNQWKEAEVAPDDGMENGFPLSTRPDSESTEERQRKLYSLPPLFRDTFDYNYISRSLDVDYQPLGAENPSEVDVSSTNEMGLVRGDGELAKRIMYVLNELCMS